MDIEQRNKIGAYITTAKIFLDAVSTDDMGDGYKALVRSAVVSRNAAWAALSESDEVTAAVLVGEAVVDLAVICEDSEPENCAHMAVPIRCLQHALNALRCAWQLLEPEDEKPALTAVG